MTTHGLAAGHLAKAAIHLSRAKDVLREDRRHDILGAAGLLVDGAREIVAAIETDVTHLSAADNGRDGRGKAA